MLFSIHADDAFLTVRTKLPVGANHYSPSPSGHPASPPKKKSEKPIAGMKKNLYLCTSNSGSKSYTESSYGAKLNKRH